MKKILYFLSVFPIIPTIALAQTPSAQSFITKFLSFTNTALIPFILGVAFLLFIINAIRFFVVEGSSEDGREKAKNLALYSVLAFVVIVVFWGVVNLFAQSLGLGKTSAPNPDYLEQNNAELKAPPSSGGSTSNGSATGDISSKPAALLPPKTDNNPCASGQSFDEDGNPCDIY